MSNQYVQSLVFNIPERLRKALYLFQKDGVLEGIKRRGRILIADEMGLGKTIQAISLGMAFKAFPILVISPAVVKFNWVDELEKWTHLEPENFAIVEGRDDIDSWKTSKFVVCTYGLFTKNSAVATHMNNHGFQTVICDESHYLKNIKAIRTTLICPLIEHAKHAILLSGTPCLNRPVELYSQVSALSEKFGTYSQYTRKFCNARRGRFGWDVSGQSNLKELNLLLQHVMIRRLKKDVLTQLPSKIRSRVFIDIMEKKKKKNLMKLMENLKDVKKILQETLAATLEGNSIAMRQGKFAHNEQRKFLMQAFHDTGVGKIPGVKKYLDNFLDSSETSKCLVFAHHIDVLDGIEKGVSEYKYRSSKSGKLKKIKYMRIDGSTPHHERQLNTKKFQTNPDCRVAIIGMLAGGVGITLTEASHVFFAELHWTPGIILQAEDRAHRIGQKNNVVINYLVAKNSIDEPMWSIICNKVNITSTALEGTRTSLKAKKTKVKQNEKDGTGSSSRQQNDNIVESDSEDEMKEFGKGDVRTFISKLGEKKKNALRASWSCDVCTLINPQKHTRCLACLTPRLKIVGTNNNHDLKESEKEVMEQHDNDEDDDETQLQKPSSSSGSSSKKNNENISSNKSSFYFNVSKYTGRIFLYSSEKKYLSECFSPEDVDNYKYGKTILPSILTTSDVNLQEVKSFISKWRKLRSFDQQQLCSKIIKPPLLAILNREQLRKKHMNASKGITTSMLSFTRYSARPPSQSTNDLNIPGDKNNDHANTKICGNCSKPLTMIDDGETHEKGSSNLQKSKHLEGQQLPNWHGIYCSFECKKAMMIKTSGGYIRQEIFKLEKGICQICNRNMHELFCRIRRLEKPDRLQQLLSAGFTISNTSKKISIVNNPKEGDFWQPDHIIPVAEGGGECDLSNFRTLCTPCHLKETKELHKRLKRKRLSESAKGTKDIRIFFGGKSILTPSTQKIKKKSALSSSSSSTRSSIYSSGAIYSHDKSLNRKTASVTKQKKRVRFQLGRSYPPSAVKKSKKIRKFAAVDVNTFNNTNNNNNNNNSNSNSKAAGNLHPTAVNVILAKDNMKVDPDASNDSDDSLSNDTDEDEMTIYEILERRERKIKKKKSQLF